MRQCNGTFINRVQKIIPGLRIVCSMLLEPFFITGNYIYIREVGIPGGIVYTVYIQFEIIGNIRKKARLIVLQKVRCLQGDIAVIGNAHDDRCLGILRFSLNTGSEFSLRKTDILNIDSIFFLKRSCIQKKFIFVGGCIDRQRPASGICRGLLRILQRSLRICDSRHSCNHYRRQTE